MESQNKGFSAIGHVLLDCVGEAPDAVLPYISHLSSPAHVEPAVMDEIFKELKNSKSEKLVWRAGGGASGLALAGRKMGLPTVLAGCVGRDEAGRFLSQNLVESGVEILLFPSEKPTGRFCKLETTMGIRLVASPQAARDIRETAIPDSFFRPGWVLHLDGLLIDSAAWIAALARRARAAGMTLSLDISTSSNAAIWGKELIGFARSFCEIVFANEAEWDALRPHVAPQGRGDVSPLWVVKKGCQGASVLDSGEWFHGATKNLGNVDDVGAGDIFAAGFLAAWLEGFDSLRCIERGNLEAAKALSERCVAGA